MAAKDSAPRSTAELASALSPFLCRLPSHPRLIPFCNRIALPASYPAMSSSHPEPWRRGSPGPIMGLFLFLQELPRARLPQTQFARLTDIEALPRRPGYGKDQCLSTVQEPWPYPHDTLVCVQCVPSLREPVIGETCIARDASNCSIRQRILVGLSRFFDST